MLAVLLALTACAEISLISDYDAATDQQVTKLHRDVETFFTVLERNPTKPACTRASNDAFYAQATTDINLLIARNEIRTKNDITKKQLVVMKDSLELLEGLHEVADSEDRCLGLDSNEMQALRGAFSTSFGAILKLELAKKRGEAEGSGN